MRIIIILSFFLSAGSLAYSAPGDITKLGFLERPSVDQVLEGFGHPNMTCTEGKKLEDEKGYTIVANCAKGSDNYNVSLWVSLDWTKGHMIYFKKRGEDD